MKKGRKHLYTEPSENYTCVIETQVLKKAKQHSEKKNVSLSVLINEYLKKLK